MANITIGGMPSTTNAADTDILHISQSGVDKNVTVEIVSKVFPIGFTYTQYPGKQSPSDMSFAGTWTNISSSFAGNFFRAEGGKASAFESGTQTDAIQGHSHSLSTANPGGTAGTRSVANYAFNNNGINDFTVHGNPNNGDGIFDTISDGVNGAVTVDTETRPKNETIIIWERTA